MYLKKKLKEETKMYLKKKQKCTVLKENVLKEETKMYLKKKQKCT